MIKIAARSEQCGTGGSN